MTVPPVNISFKQALLTAAVWLVCSRLIIGVIGIVGANTFVDQKKLAASQIEVAAAAERMTRQLEQFERETASSDQGQSRTPAVAETTRHLIASASDLAQMAGGSHSSGLDALNPKTVWHKWDALWYEQIALHGYGWNLDDPKGQAAAGFFPLYPLTLRLVMAVVPSVSFFWLGTAFSNLFTLAALTLIACRLTDRIAYAHRVMLILMTAAGAFYLSIPYTEGLFLLLVVLVMIATRRRQYLLAALFCGLMALTRVHGFASIAIPIIACRLDGDVPLKTRFTQIAAMAVMFAAPMGLYMAYLANVQGSAFAWFTRQTMWENTAPYPLGAFVGFFAHPLWLSSWLHGAYWGAYVWLLARSWRRVPLGEALFCAGALLISTQQKDFQGIYRYTVPLVPLVMAMADDDVRVRHVMIGVNLVVGVIMILAFVTNNRLVV